MEYGISHSFEDESFESKARWFQEKPLAERLKEAFEGMVLLQKLHIYETPNDHSTFKTVRILESPKR